MWMLFAAPFSLVFLLVAWAVWGWGSVRRIDGVNTYEAVEG